MRLFKQSKTITLALLSSLLLGACATPARTDASQAGILGEAIRGTSIEATWIRLETRHVRCGGDIDYMGTRNFGEFAERYHRCMATDARSDAGFTPTREWRDAVALVMGLNSNPSHQAAANRQALAELARSLIDQCSSRPTLAALAALDMEIVEGANAASENRINGLCAHRLNSIHRLIGFGCADHPDLCGRSGYQLLATMRRISPNRNQ